MGAGLDPGGPGGAPCLQQVNAVQADIAAGDTNQALADLQSYVCHMQAQTGKQIAPSLATTLISEADPLYVALGGILPLPLC